MTTSQQIIVQWSSRLYRAVLIVYPAAFRAKFGDEMVWLFEDCCRDALRQGGFLTFLLYCTQVMGDCVITATQERLNKTYGDTIIMTTQFDQQFTSTLAVFSRALRGGYNVKQVFEIIAQQAPEPTKSAFQQVLDKVASGFSLVDAINTMGDALQSAYLQRVIATMNSQRETGGNLADMLDDLNREFYPELGDDTWAKRLDLDDDYNFDQHYPLN